MTTPEGDEARDLRAYVRDCSDEELYALLKSEYATEWRWNIVADELNRRRTERNN